MKNSKIALLGFVLFLNPLFSWADDYPINKNIDIKHYSFELVLSDETDEIVGKAKITALFKKAGERTLRLDLVNQSPVNQGKGMLIEKVLIGNQPVIYSHKNNEVIINLPKPSTENEEVTLTVVYRGIPADGLRIGATKYGDRSFFNENWPNRARHWLPTVDHPSDKATSEFIVKAPSHYKVISNGLLQEESDLGNAVKLTHWKQSVPVSSWLFVLGVADFAVKYVDTFDGKSIESWVYSKNRETGFYDFDEPTKKVLEFYSNYVGQFAYEKLANIQSASVGGGMETSSAIFYGENLINGKRDERLRNVVIHELAHQWFGNAVTETTWDDAWLSEGITTYFTLMFIQNEYGEEEFQQGLAKAKKAVLELTQKMPDFSIISPRSPENEPVTSGLTYQKGAWFVHMLRDLMGEVAFKSGIRTYYAKFYNANATTDDFRNAMEAASGKDLKRFFNQWLYQPINPNIEGVWEFNSEGKKLQVTLNQIQEGGIIFELPIEIGYYEMGSSDLKVLKTTMSEKQKVVLFNVETVPEKVVIDPRNVLLNYSKLIAK
ncbi:MAG: M1 family metallopeptidase [Spirosomaceae bacterium]|nr:M1 family metallopeptidase [Spirosomataceae bacterium]